MLDTRLASHAVSPAIFAALLPNLHTKAVEFPAESHCKIS